MDQADDVRLHDAQGGGARIPLRLPLDDDPPAAGNNSPVVADEPSSEAAPVLPGGQGSLAPDEADLRLRQAAKILATGAIRAALARKRRNAAPASE